MLMASEAAAEAQELPGRLTVMQVKVRGRGVFRVKILRVRVPTLSLRVCGSCGLGFTFWFLGSVQTVGVQIPLGGRRSC